MKIKILTLFPEMFDGFVSNSIIKRAISKEAVDIEIINIRDYTNDKYGRVDTPPIGGGAGLIMKCQPIVDCLKSIDYKNSYTLLLSPKGKQFNQQKAHELVKNHQDIILICGHYEGVDDRINSYVDEQISIGDYILTGGELGAMVISDALIRLLDGAISNDSTIEETFETGLLEYPQYTEPRDFEGQKVPDILYCGNHQAIAKWRKKQSLKITKELRKDLFDKYPLSKQDKKLLEEINNGDDKPQWEIDAVNKGKKFIK